MKQLKIIIITLNLIALIFQYGLSIYRSDNGEEISGLTRETLVLQQENTDLRRQYNELASLSYIQTRALQLNLLPLSSVALTPITVAAATTVY